MTNTKETTKENNLKMKVKLIKTNEAKFIIFTKKFMFHWAIYNELCTSQ